MLPSGNAVVPLAGEGRGVGGAVVAVRAVNHAAELGLYLKDMGCH